MYDSFRPGQVWLDTNGKRIQAHGGCVMFWEGWYYWAPYGTRIESIGKFMYVLDNHSSLVASAKCQIQAFSMIQLAKATDPC